MILVLWYIPPTVDALDMFVSQGQVRSWVDMHKWNLLSPD